MKLINKIILIIIAANILLVGSTALLGVDCDPTDYQGRCGRSFSTGLLWGFFILPPSMIALPILIVLSLSGTGKKSE